jgi:hypothetical protein
VRPGAQVEMTDHAEIDRLRAEVERLTADAERLAAYVRWMAGKNASSNSAWDSFNVRMEMIERARAALRQHEERAK